MMSDRTSRRVALFAAVVILPPAHIADPATKHIWSSDQVN